MLKLIKLFTATSLTASLLACSGGSNGTSSGGIIPPPPTTAGSEVPQIRFDTIGTIPVFDSNSTQTLVYVHNFSNHTISGIQYSGKTNVEDANNTSKTQLLRLKNSATQIISTSSAAACSTIAAGGSCALTITTPVLDSIEPNGSILFSASYSDKDKQHTSSQIANLELINSLTPDGVKFASDVNISNTSETDSAYGIVYAYGSGVNQTYLVNGLKPNNAALSITQGNILGMSIPSRFVQAIEVTLPPSQNAYTTSLAMTSSLEQGGSQNATKSSKSSLKSAGFSSLSVIGSSGYINGALLIAGNPTIINTANPPPFNSGSYAITNNGTTTATLSSVTPTTNIVTTGSTCTVGKQLAPGDNCMVYYTISGSNATTGSGTITVNYAGGSTGYSSIVSFINWINTLAGPQLSITASNNPVTFTQNTGTNVTFTLENIGGYSLSAISVTGTAVTGSATASISSDGCGGVLGIHNSCQTTLHITDSGTSTNSLMRIVVTAEYQGANGAQQYERFYGLTYNSVPDGVANLVFSPSPVTMAVTGDGIESFSQTVTLTNSGTQPTTNAPVISLENNPTYLSQTNNCTVALAVNANCTINLKLGPTSATPTSGNAFLSATYNSNNNNGMVAKNKISYTVNPVAFAEVNMIATGSSGGTGASVNPYVFHGSLADSGQSITITYQNKDSSPLTIENIQDGNLGLAWSRSSSSSCKPGTTIAANGNCLLIYNNNLSNVSSVIATANYQMDFPTPSFVLKLANNLVYTVAPAITISNGQAVNVGTTISAQSIQAVITNSVTYDNSTKEVSVTSSVANSGSNSLAYSKPVLITATMEDYFTNIPTGSNCSSNRSTDGIVTQTCTMNIEVGSNTPLTLVYPINTPLFNGAAGALNTLFELITNGQVVAVNTTYIQTTIDSQ